MERKGKGEGRGAHLELLDVLPPLCMIARMRPLEVLLVLDLLADVIDQVGDVCTLFALAILHQLAKRRQRRRRKEEQERGRTLSAILLASLTHSTNPLIAFLCPPPKPLTNPSPSAPFASLTHTSNAEIFFRSAAAVSSLSVLSPMPRRGTLMTRRRAGV